jgi:cellobiose phosphorylase
MKKIIRYSAEVSVGAHGLPLIDKADWNDCLKVDVDYLTGPEKEKIYNENPLQAREALAGYSESVMNAFLLKVAIDNMKIIAELKGDKKTADNYMKQAEDMYNKVQRHAWKKDFFARILFNRKFKEGYAFLGAGGDGLSADHDINGTYFINSFSWSILSDCASDEQIEIILDCIERYLKTASGYKLCTDVDLNKISTLTAAGYYFPGDRENMGVFKHASMMAVSAMFKAAKSVREQKLARRLAKAAYWMLEKVLPYKTMQDPYKLKGNPRFCTQYINANSGEHIGPELSGTASWLALSIFACLGIEYQEDGIICDPILQEEVEDMSFELKTKGAVYDFNIKKPKGFYRCKDRKPFVFIDEKQVDKNFIPFFGDAARHKIIIDFYSRCKNHPQAGQG